MKIVRSKAFGSDRAWVAMAGRGQVTDIVALAEHLGGPAILIGNSRGRALRAGRPPRPRR
jgi:hypothetical protein